jgi:cytochrome c oxidase cbb3-type subunit 4
MDAGLLRGIFTVLMLMLFVCICFWAWSSRRKPVFDAVARLPLESDDGSPPGPARRAGLDESKNRGATGT